MTNHNNAGPVAAASIPSAVVLQAVDGIALKRAVDAWVKLGLLPPPKKRGGKLMWRWAEVDRYLENGGAKEQCSADAQAEAIRHATRQAVIDVRCCLDWLQSRGYERLGIVGRGRLRPRKERARVGRRG